MENKTLWRTLVGTLQGDNSEGSAKRICMAFICLCLLLTSKMVYLVCFRASVMAVAPTVNQISVVKMFQPLNWVDNASLWMFGGLTTFEGIVNAIKWFRGGSSQEKKPE